MPSGRIYSSPTSSVPDPDRPHRYFDLDKHAAGRLEVEAEKLLHAVYLKAIGKFGSYPLTLAFTGAVYQDRKGSADYHGCHRSISNPKINGRNVPDFAPAHLPDFRRLLIAPLEVTDPLPAPANYGDRLVEIVTADPLLLTLRRALDNQPANRPVETNMLIDAVGDLMIELQRGYHRAIDKAGDTLAQRGWVEVPIQDGARFLASASRAGHAETRPNAETRDLMQELRTMGPQSPLVEQRMEELAFEFYKAGPSRYGRLVIDYLAISQDLTHRCTPTLLLNENVKDATARLEAAAKQGSS